jgi:hypothetical protein
MLNLDQGGHRQSSGSSRSLNAASAEMRACIEREIGSRKTSPCALSFYRALEAAPSDAAKTANLVGTAGAYKVLLAYDKGEIDWNEAVEKLNLIAMDTRVQVENANRAAASQAQIDNQRQQQALRDAARIMRESTTPIMTPQPVDNSMNCRSYRNGNEIITNCR